MCNCDVVFCRYNEPETAIVDVLKNTNCRVFVYDRGITPLPFHGIDKNNLIHIIDDNHGREEAVYLRHISENYESIPDIIVFSQARNTDSSIYHIGGFVSWLNQLKPNIAYESFITEILTCNQIGCPHHPNLPLLEIFSKIYPDKSLPDMIHFNPCAIFATSNSTLKKLEKSTYTILNDMARDSRYGYLMLPWSLERLWKLILVGNDI